MLCYTCLENNVDDKANKGRFHSLLNTSVLCVCEFTSKKGHHIAASHFCILIVLYVSNTVIPFLFIHYNVVYSFTVGNYLQLSTADACTTIHAAVSFISIISHMVGLRWLLFIVISEAG